MHTRKVVSPKNLPMRAPLTSTLVFWLVLDKLGAPGWVWGVLGTLLAVLWIAYFVDIFKREDIDILNNE